LNLSEKAHPNELEAILRQHETSEYENLFLQHNSFKSLLDHHRQKVYDRASEFEKIISGEVKYKFKSNNREIYHISPQIRSLTENEQCIKWGFGKTCSCGHEVAIPYFCRKRNHCPVCNRRYSQYRGRSIFETLTLVPDTYVIQLVLTYPGNYFSSTDPKEEIESLIHKQSRKFIAATFGKRVGGVKKVHSWKSKDPLDSPHWHIHILIPSFVFYPVTINSLDNSRKITVDYAIKHLRALKTKEQLNSMRKLWGEIIGYPQEVNIHYEYSNKSKKIAHWCNYISRCSILDINKFLKDKGEHYKLTQKEEEWFWYHTNYKPHFKRIRWFGFLCDSQRGKTLKYLFSKDWAELLKMDKKFLWVCPNCGGLIDKLDSDVITISITDKTLLAIQCESEEWEMFKNGLKTGGVG
jgi:hypothetical protein